MYAANSGPPVRRKHMATRLIEGEFRCHGRTMTTRKLSWEEGEQPQAFADEERAPRDERVGKTASSTFE